MTLGRFWSLSIAEKGVRLSNVKHQVCSEYLSRETTYWFFRRHGWEPLTCVREKVYVNSNYAVSNHVLSWNDWLRQENDKNQSRSKDSLYSFTHSSEWSHPKSTLHPRVNMNVVPIRALRRSSSVLSVDQWMQMILFTLAHSKVQKKQPISIKGRAGSKARTVK